MTEPTRAEKLQLLRDRLDDLALEQLAEEYLEARDQRDITTEYVGSLEHRIIARMREEEMDLLPGSIADFNLSYRSEYDWQGLDDMPAALEEVGLDPRQYLHINDSWEIRPGMGAVLQEIIVKSGHKWSDFIDKKRSIRPKNSRTLMAALNKLGTRASALRQKVTVSTTPKLNVVMKVDKETGEVLD